MLHSSDPAAHRQRASRTRRCLPLALAAAAALLSACATSGTPSGTDLEAMHTHHTIDYIEFQVTDLAAAKQFYGDAFGWTFTDYGPDYAGIRKADGDGEVGGMLQVPDVQTGGPLVVLYSSDVDGSVRAVRDAGGKIAKEPFEFPGGRRFHFVDPSGNELAVWSER